jgi:hypothetical protein
MKAKIGASLEAKTVAMEAEAVAKPKTVSTVSRSGGSQDFDQAN